MRALWTGSLNFGLINIPVRLYSGSQESSLDLDMLHAKDHGKIRYARICTVDGKEIPYNEIVKGYEVEEGQYVVLTDEDFKRADTRKTKMIEIVSFVKEAEIDPRYYEKPYFLEPEKGADKPYLLLREALRKSKKVAIARFVLRKREHIAAVKPEGQALILNQLRFASELRSPEDLKLPKGEARAKEVDMALMLINQLTGKFKPEEFKDTYTKELQDFIKAKAKGKKPAKRGKAPEPTGAKDLMELLKASLEKPRTHDTAGVRG